MSRGALSSFYNVSTYNGKVIEYSIFFHYFSFKSKVKIIREFGHTLGILGKPFVSRI